MFMNTFMGYTMWDYEADAPRDVAGENSATLTTRRQGRSTNAILKARHRKDSGMIRTSCSA